MSHLKIKELREKSKDDLLKQLAEFKKELSQLRVAQQSSSTASRVGRINPIRKSIARLLTVLNQNERTNLRKFYADKKLKKQTPKALKAKLTKSRRLALKDSEKNRKTRSHLRGAGWRPDMCPPDRLPFGLFNQSDSARNDHVCGIRPRCLLTEFVGVQDCANVFRKLVSQAHRARLG